MLVWLPGHAGGSSLSLIVVRDTFSFWFLAVCGRVILIHFLKSESKSESIYFLIHFLKSKSKSKSASLFDLLFKK